MQTKAEVLEGPSLPWFPAYGHSPSEVRLVYLCIVELLCPTKREARLPERHSPGGKRDTNGDGGSAGLAIRLRKMKRGDALCQDHS